MPNKNYKSQYLHQKWQKNRLEILERDSFTCQLCASDTKTLNVHHKKYIRGREVWDYKNSNFITLCCLCHKRAHISDEHLTALYNKPNIKNSETTDEKPVSELYAKLINYILPWNSGISFTEYKRINIHNIMSIIDKSTNDVDIGKKYIEHCKIELKNNGDVKYLEDKEYIMNFLSQGVIS